MKLRQLLFALTSIAACYSALPVFAAPAEMNTEKVKQIEKIVHDYLISNPNVLLDASRALQQKQQQEMISQSQKAIAENISDIFDNGSPVIGNTKGDVTLVEFFDYQCVHCKKMNKEINELVKSDEKLRVVFKMFPILGDNSKYAAKAVLAARAQGKFKPLHEALLNTEQRLTKPEVLKLARSVGINVKKLQASLDQAKITEAIDSDMALAGQLRLAGTPAFILGGHPATKNMKTVFVPGAASKSDLQEMIKDLRAQQLSHPIMSDDESATNNN